MYYASIYNIISKKDGYIYRIIVNLVEDTCFIVETVRSRQDKTCIETKFTIILYISDFYWTMPIMSKTIHKCQLRIRIVIG